MDKIRLFKSLIIYVRLLVLFIILSKQTLLYADGLFDDFPIVNDFQIDPENRRVNFILSRGGNPSIYYDRHIESIQGYILEAAPTDFIEEIYVTFDGNTNRVVNFVQLDSKRLVLELANGTIQHVPTTRLRSIIVEEVIDAYHSFAGHGATRQRLINNTPNYIQTREILPEGMQPLRVSGERTNIIDILHSPLRDNFTLEHLEIGELKEHVKLNIRRGAEEFVRDYARFGFSARTNPAHIGVFVNSDPITANTRFGFGFTSFSDRLTEVAYYDSDILLDFSKWERLTDRGILPPGDIGLRVDNLRRNWAGSFNEDMFNDFIIPATRAYRKLHLGLHNSKPTYTWGDYYGRPQHLKYNMTLSQVINPKTAVSSNTVPLQPNARRITNRRVVRKAVIKRNIRAIGAKAVRGGGRFIGFTARTVLPIFAFYEPIGFLKELNAELARGIPESKVINFTTTLKDRNTRTVEVVVPVDNMYGNAVLNTGEGTVKLNIEDANPKEKVPLWIRALGNAPDAVLGPIHKPDHPTVVHRGTVTHDIGGIKKYKVGFQYWEYYDSRQIADNTYTNAIKETGEGVKDQVDHFPANWQKFAAAHTSVIELENQNLIVDVPCAEQDFDFDVTQNFIGEGKVSLTITPKVERFEFSPEYSLFWGLYPRDREREFNAITKATEEIRGIMTNSKLTVGQKNLLIREKQQKLEKMVREKEKIVTVLKRHEDTHVHPGRFEVVLEGKNQLEEGREYVLFQQMRGPDSRIKVAKEIRVEKRQELVALFAVDEQPDGKTLIEVLNPSKEKGVTYDIYVDKPFQKGGSTKRIADVSGTKAEIRLAPGHYVIGLKVSDGKTSDDYREFFTLGCKETGEEELDIKLIPDEDDPNLIRLGFGPSVLNNLYGLDGKGQVKVMHGEETRIYSENNLMPKELTWKENHWGHKHFYIEHKTGCHVLRAEKEIELTHSGYADNPSSAVAITDLTVEHYDKTELDDNGNEVVKRKHKVIAEVKGDPYYQDYYKVDDLRTNESRLFKSPLVLHGEGQFVSFPIVITGKHNNIFPDAILAVSNPPPDYELGQIVDKITLVAEQKHVESTGEKEIQLGKDPFSLFHCPNGNAIAYSEGNTLVFEAGQYLQKGSCYCQYTYRDNSTTTPGARREVVQVSDDLEMELTEEVVFEAEHVTKFVMIDFLILDTVLVGINCATGEICAQLINYVNEEPDLIFPDERYQFKWSAGETTRCINPQEGITNYTVTVTHTTPHTTKEIVKVTSFEYKPLDGKVVFTDVSCHGEDDGSAKAEIVGGTTPYTYDWDNGETTQEVLGLIAGDYKVKITDAGGCTLHLSGKVNEPEKLTVNSEIEQGCGKVFDVCYTISGGTAFQQVPHFQWTFNGGTPTRVTYDTILYITSDTVYTTREEFKVECEEDTVERTVYEEAKEEKNCKTTKESYDMPLVSVTKEKKTRMVEKISTEYETDQNGNKQYKTVFEPEEYYEEKINVTADTKTYTDKTCEIVNKRVPVGKKQITVTKCDTVKVVQVDTLVKKDTILKIEAKVCANNVPEGKVSFKVTDALGCSETVDDELKHDPKKVLNAEIEGNGCDGTLEVNVNGGEPGYTYLWNLDPSQTNSTLTGLATGTHHITVDVSDANGCNALASKVIEVIEVTLSGSFKPGTCDFTAGVSILSTNNASFLWSTGTTGNKEENVTPGKTYYVTATNHDIGCSKVEQITVPQCGDQCPNDPNKIEPGVCGCGVPDLDPDGDGVHNCNDLCPNDSHKTEPGQCGCGVSDLDSDGDNTPNCHDLCHNDPNKIDPGQCGCGQPETDKDKDNTPDCVDLCPNDPNKTEPGQCGCRQPETDRDSDNTPDCVDLCPDNETQTNPVFCGDCDLLAVDVTGNGDIYCVNPCDIDFNGNNELDDDDTKTMKRIAYQNENVPNDKNADVNGDGTIDQYDYRAVVGAYLVLKGESFNCNTSSRRARFTTQEPFQTVVQSSSADKIIDIRVYPNPVIQGQPLHLQGYTQGATAYLYDGIGNLVQTLSLEEQNHDIQTTYLSPGIYIVNVIENDIIEQYRFRIAVMKR